MSGAGKKLLPLLAVAAFLATASALADQGQMRVERRGENLLLTARFEEVFNQQVKKRLSSGFASRILVEARVLDRNEQPLYYGLLQITILYDIWEERFLVSLQEKEGLRRLVFGDMEQLVSACGSVKNMLLYPLQPLSANQPLRVWLQVTVNPTQPGLQEKVRQYLANPEGGRRLSAPRSFFGSFSKIFVSQQNLKADAVYNFRSPLRLLAGEE